MTTTAGPTGPAKETTVLGVTIVSDPAPAPAVAPSVHKNNIAPEVASAELPRTGGGHFQFLMTLALSLLGAGIALRAAFGRRIRSASFPG